MTYKKLVNITEDQRQQLEEMQMEIKVNGVQVSTNQLIRDSLQFVLNQHKNTIIGKYLTFYGYNGHKTN